MWVEGVGTYARQTCPPQKKELWQLFESRIQNRTARPIADR